MKIKHGQELHQLLNANSILQNDLNKSVQECAYIKNEHQNVYKNSRQEIRSLRKKIAVLQGQSVRDEALTE